jgi:hypothetical protein
MSNKLSTESGTRVYSLSSRESSPLPITKTTHCPSSIVGLPQGSILSPILYTADLPSHPSTTLHTLADDPCILAPHKDPIQASLLLQDHLDSIESWFRRWSIKVNPTKNQHITFTLRRATCPPVFLNQTPLPEADVVHYPRLKRKDLNRRYKLLKLLLDSRRFSIKYTTIMKPIWTYGLKICRSAKPSNI